MTQEQFNAQFKTGDFNALWAAVENHISGEINAAKAKFDAAIAEKQKEIYDLTVTLDSASRQLEALLSTPALPASTLDL